MFVLFFLSIFYYFFQIILKMSDLVDGLYDKISTKENELKNLQSQLMSTQREKKRFEQEIEKMEQNNKMKEIELRTAKAVRNLNSSV